MKKLPKVFCCLYFLSLLQFGQVKESTSGKPGPDPFDPLRKKMADLVKKGEIPSISVAVARSGKIIWEESFGWASREKMIRATPHTPYSLASVSKTITATGIMTLVRDRKINLNAPVHQYISPMRLTVHEGDPDHIIVRHLLHHTSGLPMHCSLYFCSSQSRRPSIEEMVVRYGFTAHKPGRVYEYSNLGYGLLGHMISRVSGKSFGEYIRDEVFLPLGMLRSSLNIGPGLEEFTATRYDRHNHPIPFYDSNHEGASCFYSSVHDLIKFALFHLGHRLPDQEPILSDSLLNEMHSARDPDLPVQENEYYSFGLVNLLDENGYHILSHDGGMPGVSTTLDLIPSEKAAIVILMNCSDSRLYDFREELLGIVLPKYKENLSKSQSQSHSSTGKTPIKPPLNGEWEGVLKTHERDIPVAMVFQEDGDIFITVKSTRLESVCPRKLNRVSFRNNCLLGLFSFNIPTADTMDYRHFCVLKVYLRGNELKGFVTAVSTEELSFLDLPYYISLKKK